MGARILEIQIIGECNLNCKNCSALVDFNYNKNYQITLDEINEIIKVAKLSRIQVIVITGGEAIMHPEIEEIIRLVTKAGFQVWMNTNGILKTKLENLKKLFPNNLVYKNTQKTSSVQPLFKNFHFTTQDILDIGGEVLAINTPEQCILASRSIYHLGKYYQCCLGGMCDQVNNLNVGIEFNNEPIDIEQLREKQRILCSHCGEQGIQFTNPNKVDISTIGSKWKRGPI